MIVGAHFARDEIDSRRFHVATSLCRRAPQASIRPTQRHSAVATTPEQVANVLPTGRDAFCYFNCQLQCRCRLRARNARLAPRARAFDERSELKPKRFLSFNIDPIARDMSPNPSIDFATLILVIEREVSVLLKDANLAKTLGTDTARGHVCHAAIFKMQSRIGDVFAPAKDRHPYRVKTPERRAHKMQNDFQVMNH